MRRIVVPSFGPAGQEDAARVLDQNGDVRALIAEPVNHPDAIVFRDAVVDAVLDADFGDVILAGVAFAPRWGGDAIGFT